MAGHLDGAPVLVEAPDARTHQDAAHQRAHRCNKKIDVLVTSLMFNFVTSLQIVLLECVVAISCYFLPLLRFSAIKREALFTHSNRDIMLVSYTALPSITHGADTPFGVNIPYWRPDASGAS